MRLATWNVNSLGARLPRVEAWLAEMEPDVICLQETKLADTAFPDLAFRALGYEAAHHGLNQWNGVAILSRVGLDDVVNGFPDEEAPDVDARMIWATCGGVRVASVYVPNGRDLADEHYQYKLAWLARLRAVLDSGAHGADPAKPLAICGDWNIAPADDDVWDIAEFAESTHVSEPERAALRDVQAWGLVDLLRAHYPDPGLYTYWDYRAGCFHKKMGMRIDHILATAPLAERCRFVFVDRNARKGSKPSDHTVLQATFDG
jgi:exodeoxyribonuclease-3